MFKKPMPPIKGALDKKPAPAPAKQGGFRPNQVSEDTERQMFGKPQIHGAAMLDEEPAAEAPTAVPPVEGDQEGGEMENLKAENLELRSRLEAIESHLGLGQKQEAPGAPATPPQDDNYDDGGY